MKKTLLLGALFTALFAVQTFAEGTVIKVDDSEVTFEEGTEPYIDNGTTFVPLRGVFEKMGYNVVWDGDNQQAILTGNNGSEVIVVPNGSSVVKANGTEVDMGVSTRNINGRLMLPLRAVTEVTGGSTDWDAETKTIDIKTKAKLEQEAADREREAQDEINRANSEREEEERQKAEEKQALEEARAAAKAAEDAAEAERNYDYTAYPTKVLEIADTLDAKLDEGYKVAVRSYVNNADVIVPYSDRIQEYITNTDEELKDATIKDEQKKIQDAFNKYYEIAKTAANYIKSASTASYSGESLRQSTTKGDRSLGSMNAYRKFQQDYEKNERDLDAAKAELKAVCDAYTASLNK
jgi:hypothetical protein